MILGILVASIGIAPLGFLHNYWAMFLAIAIGGTGVALFHPEGGRNANLVAGEKKGTGMSIFAVGGNIGFSVGPVLAAALIPWLGLKGTALFFAPSVIMAVVILSRIPALKRFAEQAAKKEKEHSGADGSAGVLRREDDWPAFGKLTATVVIRSITAQGMLTFIPLFFMGILLLPEADSSLKLSIYSISCAFATFVGGRLADRFGFNRIIRIFMISFIPSIAIFLLTKSVFLATLMLIPLAFTVNGPYSTMVALGQTFLPNRIGLSSGITLGVAISLGGVVAPGLGKIADTYGLMTAMLVVGASGAIAAILALFIPKPKEMRGKPAEVAMKEES
jgi:FSR family fosmidomycin resistance protein-like MFS transporter